MKSAMWYWWRSGCNRLADKDDIRTITKRINGGLNGLADRQYYYRKAKRILML
jgi:putative chitinase